jgi:DnaA family protein
MRQLLLEWDVAQPQTLDNFVVGRNKELTALITQISQRSALTLDKRFVMMWGESGSGKSHLLHALQELPDTLYLSASSAASDILFSDHYHLYLIDDCDALNPEAQIAAFGLFNQIREAGGVLITTAKHPPGQLLLREDLRTRLGWGLIYQLHGLSDEEKIAALSLSAETRGLQLSTGVIPYLLTHFRRDMQSLSAMLNALDRYSLETKRAITVPLLRELLELDDTNSSL